MKSWLLPVLLAACALPCAAAEGPEWIAVTPRDLAGAAEALARHRREAGLEAAVKIAEEIGAPGEAPDPRAVKDFVKKTYSASRGRLAYLVLLGDAPSPSDAPGLVRIPPRVLPPSYSDKRWACAPDLASDAWFAMLDDDPVPDLAVGRLPADTAEEAEGMVRRIVAYEKSADFGPWRRRLDIVAGPGGFGPLVDMFLESTFRTYVSDLIPPAFDVRITYANPSSPYCYPLPTFPEKALELLNEGSLVWAYVGHGSPTAFDRVRGEGGDRPIFDLKAAARTEVRKGAPIVAVIACSTGHFDHPRTDSVVEALMKAERGPAAVVASTRVSQPYANGILAREMIARLFDPEQPTLGKALLAVQAALIEPKGADQETLDRLSGLLMGPDKLRPCREDHVHLYALFGDPATPIGRPRGDVKVSAPARARAGETMTVCGVFDRVYEGEAVATLEAKRGSPPRGVVPVAELKGAERFEAMERNWRSANDLVLSRASARVEGESLKIGLAFPAEGAPDGEYVIKVFVSDAKGCAMGATRIALGEGKAEGEEEGY